MVARHELKRGDFRESFFYSLVMGARLFAFSWVSVGAADFVPQPRLAGI